MAAPADQLKACRKSCESLRTQVDDLRMAIQERVLAEAAQQRDESAPGFSPRSRRELKGHFGKIYSLSWNVNDTDIVSASQDGKLMVWNSLTTNKKLAIPLRSAWVMTCCFSPTGQFVACGGLDNLCSIFRINEQSRGWDAQQPYRELQQHEGYLSCCQFIDDNTVITSSGDSTCIVWDVPSKTPRQTFLDHTGDVMSVSPNPKFPNLFVSGSTDASARVWDIRTERCVGNYTGHDSDINSVKWFPDGYAFASGSDDASARLFDRRAYRQLNVYEEPDTIFPGVTCLDFSKSGNYLFCGYDDDPYCMIWSTATAERVSPMDHPMRVSCLNVSPSGSAIATGSWDCLLRIWC